MKQCPNCSYNNPSDSLFCQECGKELLREKESKTKSSNQYIWTCDHCNKEFATKKKCDEHELICELNPANKKQVRVKGGHSAEIYNKFKKDYLEDVVFTPSQKKDQSWIWVIVAMVGTLFLLIIMFSSFSSSETNDSYPKPTPTSYLNKNILLSNISIENYEVKWIGEEQYFVGTMKNKNSEHIQDISVRVDFAWDKAMSKIFDTRYVVVDTVPSRGAFSFQLPVYVYETKQFWYQFKIEDASVLE